MQLLEARRVPVERGDRVGDLEHRTRQGLALLFVAREVPREHRAREDLGVS
jgi:hypothetical protein